MSEHTPTPWKAVADYSPQEGGPDDFSPYIVDTAGRNVAAAMMIPECEGSFLANRDLIVRAVNSHADLVAVLEELLDMTDSDPADFDHQLAYDDCLESAKDQARKALAKARGGAP